MAGDWIKMRTDLYRSPKVCLMADVLTDAEGDLARHVSNVTRRDMSVTRNITRNACVGALLSVWGVMRHQGQRDGDDLFCRNATIAVIDDISDLPGFGQCMEFVGWVVQTDDGIVFPRFYAENNTDPLEKSKAAAAQRQARYRQRKKSETRNESDATSNVTEDVTRNVTVTHREEKSREENKEKEKDKKESRAKRSIPPDFSITPEMREWAQQQKLTVDIDSATERWTNSMLAKGSKYANWEAAWRNGMKIAQKWHDEKYPSPTSPNGHPFKKHPRYPGLVKKAQEMGEMIVFDGLPDKLIFISPDGSVSG